MGTRAGSPHKARSWAGVMSTLSGGRSKPSGPYRFIWPLLALVLMTADYVVWRDREAERAAGAVDPFSMANLDKWMASCLEYPRGYSCHVTFCYRYVEASGDEQVAILGVSEHFATITARMQRGATVSWRVDTRPWVETRSIEGDGAVLPHESSAKLLSEMLNGKRLTVRFNEPTKGRRVERNIALDEFPAAYAAYQGLCKSRASSAKGSKQSSL